MPQSKTSSCCSASILALALRQHACANAFQKQRLLFALGALKTRREVKRPLSCRDPWEGEAAELGAPQGSTGVDCTTAGKAFGLKNEVKPNDFSNSRNVHLEGEGCGMARSKVSVSSRSRGWHLQACSQQDACWNGELQNNCGQTIVKSSQAKAASQPNDCQLLSLAKASPSWLGST